MSISPDGRDELGLSASGAEDVEEKDFEEALGNIAASGILGDSDVIAEIIREPDATLELAEEVGLEERMADIATELLSRAPEHDEIGRAHV